MTKAVVSATPRGPVSSHTGALLTFFMLTFGWTWGFWAAVALLADPAGPTTTLLLLASAFGPSLSGLATVMVFDGPAGAGMRRPHLRLWRSWRWPLSLTQALAGWSRPLR
jgi:hypothetical protein